jgi:chromosome partitioning protein
MRAAARREVLLVDTDKQGSASAWCAIRGENAQQPPVTCVQKFGKAIASDLRALARKYQDIVIDAGGRDSVELRAAMTVADRLYIPVQASQFDVWTLDAMNELVSQAVAINEGLRAFALLNRASTHPTVREVQEARTTLRDYEHLEATTSIIRDRIAFRKAAREGRAVAELTDPDPRAVNEIQAFFNEVFDG